MDKPKRGRGRPVTTGETPKRYFRVPDELWNAARQKASAMNSNVTVVLVRALREFVDGD